MNHPDRTAGEVTLAQVEAAINIWRNRTAVAPDADGLLVLGAQARALADLYGTMVFTRADSVDVSSLSAAQRAALQVAHA